MKPTIKKLNTYLQARVPQIQVVRGNGYFYFAEWSEKMGWQCKVCNGEEEADE